MTQLKKIESLTLEHARPIVGIMKRVFDSHDFINMLIVAYPLLYMNILREYDDIANAHGAIAVFLRDNQDSLHIQRGEQKVESENIFGHISSCEYWEKI